ncbi:unnamed protein product, partial [Allacma fusca]
MLTCCSCFRNKVRSMSLCGPKLSLCCNHSLIGKETQGNLERLLQKKSSGLRISPIWLNELEQSYQIAFEHQFGLLNFDQNKRLIDQFGYTFVLNSTIREMLDNPRARLFQFQDHWGEWEDYNFSRINSQIQIQRNSAYQPNSKLKEMYSNSSLLNAQIEGMIKNPMVRLFSGENLTGESQDFHLGNNRNLAVTYKGCSNVDGLAN